MRAADVKVGSLYQVRVGSELACVRVIGTRHEMLYRHEIERGKKPRTLFVCVRAELPSGSMPLPKARPAASLTPFRVDLFETRLRGLWRLRGDLTHGRWALGELDRLRPLALALGVSVESAIAAQVQS